MTREEREQVSYWSFIQWRRRLGGETAGEQPLRFVQVLPVEAGTEAVRIRIGAALIEVGVVGRDFTARIAVVGGVFVLFNRQRDKVKLLFIPTSAKIDVANSRAEPD